MVLKDIAQFLFFPLIKNTQIHNQLLKFLYWTEMAAWHILTYPDTYFFKALVRFSNGLSQPHGAMETGYLPMVYNFFVWLVGPWMHNAQYKERVLWSLTNKI